MPDMKRSLSTAEFCECVRTGADEHGFVFLEDIHVEDAPEKRVLLVPFEGTAIRHLRLRRCVLPKIEFIGHTGDELGFHLTLQDIASPSITILGAVTDVTTTDVHLGALRVLGTGGLRAVRFGGRIETLTLIGRAPERIEWGGIIAGHLDVEIPPCVTLVAEGHGTESSPLTVRRWIQTTHAAWARYFALLCPGIPVFLNGNPKRL